jgi:hypothetical protein
LLVNPPLVAAPEIQSFSTGRPGWRSFGVTPPGLSRLPLVRPTEKTDHAAVFNAPSFPPLRIAIGRPR